MRFVRILGVVLLFSGAVALAQDAPSIGFGETIQGLLSTAEREVEYRFTGEQGQFITVTMTQIDDMDPYLRLEDTSGNVLTEDDDSAGNLNARIGPYKLPTNGVYTIVATSLGGEDLGQFTVSLAATIVRRIEYGQRITGQLTPDEPEIEYTFTSDPGAVVSIDMESNDFDSFLTLYSASPRTELIADDDGGVYHNSRIGPYPLSEGGDYNIAARSLSGSDIGEFTLILTHVNPEPLVFNKALDVQLSGGLARYFSFEGHAGQVIDIRVDSGNTFDTYLTLIGPDSNEIVSVEDVNDQIDPSLSNIILNSEGTYFVVVQPNVSLDARTPVTVKLVESVLPVLDSGPQTIHLGELDTNHLLTFSGAAGEHVVVHIKFDSAEPISPNVTITQGGQEIASLSTYTISDEISLGVKVPVNGPVVINVQDYNYYDMDVTVTLERQQPTA